MFGRILLTMVIWIFGVAISVGYLISQLTYTIYRQLEITPAIETSITQYLDGMRTMAQASVEAGNSFFSSWYTPSLQGFLAYPETTFAPWWFQMGVFILCGIIVLAATISTVAIWNNAGASGVKKSRADRDVAPLGKLLRENDRQRVRVADEAAKSKRNPQPAAYAISNEDARLERLEHLQELMHEFARGTLDLNTLSPDEREWLQQALENQFTRDQIAY